LVSPGSAERAVVAASACPTFSWGAPPAGAELELDVYVLQEGQPSSTPAIRETLPAGTTAWTPSRERCLVPGTYAWSVRAPGEPAAPRVFLFAVEPDPARKLERLLASLEGRRDASAQRTATGSSDRAAAPPGAPPSRETPPRRVVSAVVTPCVAGSQNLQDVDASSPFCAWIQGLYADAITEGCEPDHFCPDAPVTRQHLAMFLERAIHGGHDHFGELWSGSAARGLRADNAQAAGVGLFGYASGTGLTRGVYGQADSSSGYAVEGFSGTGVGVWGHTTSNIGVLGQSTSSIGVVGSSSTTAGVLGSSGATSVGTQPAAGVQGLSNAAVGALGRSLSNDGVFGRSDSGRGVFGQSGTGAGVSGLSSSGPGVRGESTSGPAGQFVGDVTVSDDLAVTGDTTSNDFRYPAPRARKVAVPAAAFTPSNPSQSFSNPGVQVVIIDGGPGNAFVGAVYLPEDASITHASCYLRDNTAAATIEVSLWNFATQLGSAESGTAFASGSSIVVGFDINPPVTVDNSTFGYLLAVYTSADCAVNDCILWGCHVDYTQTVIE
jgi:hypothetical protein